jgi:hypothetical protein
MKQENEDCTKYMGKKTGKAEKIERKYTIVIYFIQRRVS